MPKLDSAKHGQFIPLNSLCDNILSSPSFDALLVSGLLPEDNKKLFELCKKIGTEFIVFEHPSNDVAIISDVVANIAGKLYSHEMPNNIDFADIRDLNQRSDVLFAFNSKQSALDFLVVQALGEVIGGIHLAHGQTELSEFEATNKELLSYISEHGFFCSSFYRDACSESTILLGIKWWSASV
ncbi:hypothetical protein L2737_16260 [Shewanella electrodiphila]|uniref:Uncharacterized protein n=1 Tax=Shewanella electrodiphila TaxID=934143 RepID=A0ABT0KSM2_9GAMM|nr:hypothetical protein [Shewanella electrodiphila]MCL1046862.1 hypothetical protein [Shewanella electrodiphila]